MKVSELIDILCEHNPDSDVSGSLNILDCDFDFKEEITVV